MSQPVRRRQLRGPSLDGIALPPREPYAGRGLPSELEPLSAYYLGFIRLLSDTYVVLLCEVLVAVVAII